MIRLENLDGVTLVEVEAVGGISLADLATALADYRHAPVRIDDPAADVLITYWPRYEGIAHGQAEVSPRLRPHGPVGVRVRHSEFEEDDR